MFIKSSLGKGQTEPESIQLIGVPLHQRTPSLQKFAAVVRGSNAVLVRVRELGLDDVRLPLAVRIGVGREHGATSVGRHLLLVPAQIADGGQKGAVRQVLGRRTRGRKAPCRPARILQLPEQLQRLPRERNAVLPPALHPACGHGPRCGLQVDFLPLRPKDLLGAACGPDRHEQGRPHDGRVRIVPDVLHEPADFSVVGQRREMALAMAWLEDHLDLKVLARVRLDGADPPAVLQRTRDRLEYAPGRLLLAFEGWLGDNADNVLRLEPRGGERADFSGDVGLVVGPALGHVGVSPGRPHGLVPSLVELAKGHLP